MKTTGENALLACAASSGLLRNPSTPVLGGRGEGVRGDRIPCEISKFLHARCTPSPLPLSPEYRGEGNARNESRMKNAKCFHQATPTLSPRVQGETGAIRLVCQIFLAWLIMASAALAQPVSGRLDPEMDKPYRLQVVVHVADNRFLTPLFQEQLLNGVRDRLRLALGALAKVEVTTAHPLLADVAAKGLETGLDNWDQLTGTKTHFVFVDFIAGTYSLQARQFDGMTGLASPTGRRAPTFASRSRLRRRLVEEDFGIVGTVTAVNDNKVTLALKAGMLADKLSRWVKTGDVFAISRITKSGDNLRGTRVPWALLKCKPRHVTAIASAGFGTAIGRTICARCRAFWAIAVSCSLPWEGRSNCG